MERIIQQVTFICKILMILTTLKVEPHKWENLIHNMDKHVVEWITFTIYFYKNKKNVKNKNKINGWLILLIWGTNDKTNVRWSVIQWFTINHKLLLFTYILIFMMYSHHILTDFLVILYWETIMFYKRVKLSPPLPPHWDHPTCRPKKN